MTIKGTSTAVRRGQKSERVRVISVGTFFPFSGIPQITLNFKFVCKVF